MAVSLYPAPSAGKTAYRLSLTGGSSWTVPAGVTYINVTCVGGGGGGGAGSVWNVTPTAGSAGGSTSFTGATTASGGAGGALMWENWGTVTLSSSHVGTSEQSNSGNGGEGGFGQYWAGSASGGRLLVGGRGANGQVVTSTLATTPGAAISYSIGGGGSGGSGTNAVSGGNGGSGRIDIEYWV